MVSDAGGAGTPHFGALEAGRTECRRNLSIKGVEVELTYLNATRCRPGAVLICVNASEANQGSAPFCRSNRSKWRFSMNPRSRFRLGPVFSVAVSMVIGDTGVAKAQGAEIGRYEYLNSCASCHRTTAKAMVRS